MRILRSRGGDARAAPELSSAARMTAIYEQPNKSRWSRVFEWLVVLSTIAFTLPGCFLAESLPLRFAMIAMALGAIG
jgi:hypothetical protein